MLTRIVALSLCVAAISSACGGGGGNEEADGSGVTQASDGRPAFTETCITGMRAFASGDISEADARKVAEGFCSQAAARGLLTDKDATWSDLAPVLQQNLDLLDPLCVTWGRQGFEQLPPSVRADVEVTFTSAEWGRQFCRAFFDADYIGSDGTLSPSELSPFIQDHPELYSPFMVATLMTAYDPSFGVSRAAFKRVAERAIGEALARGLVTARTMTDYDLDQERFKEIFLDALQKYSKD
jgi:hypothetical protein